MFKKKVEGIQKYVFLFYRTSIVLQSPGLNKDMLVLQQIKKIKTSTQVNHGIIAKENNNNKKIHEHHILESHAKYYHKE